VLLRDVAPTRFAWAVLLFLGLASSPAFARTRLAVLVVAEDGALADNLAEVAISHLAQRDDWELVGGHELRVPLAAILPAAGLGACVSEPACRASVAATARVERAIIGIVQQRDGCFSLDLTLVDMRTGAAEARSSETVPAEPARLIPALREGIDRLFAPDSAPPRLAAPAVPKPAPPRVAADALLAAGPPRSRLSPRHDEDLPSSRHESLLLPYLGLGAAGTAVVALSAAAVTGSFATEPLAGANRAQMQMDLARREDYATATNVLLGVGTACAAGAAVALYRWWHDSRRATAHQPLSGAGLTH
jgi:hypothetical protein